jgi:NMD protein affecting ribosome stability and mRNA decay
VYERYCPRCGTQMQMGGVWADPEFDQYLEKLGIKREDIE